MKKFHLFLLAVMVLLPTLVILSCRKQPITDSNEITSKGGKLTIEKARQVFESQFMATKSGGDIKDQELFDPGDIAMIWNKAQWDMNDVIESVDVPIDATDNYWVWQKKVYAGDTVFVRIPTTQRMVIFKNRSLDTTISYLLTLIPDGDYYLNNRDYDEHFLHGGDKGNFTGWATYHSLDGYQVISYLYDEGKLKYYSYFRTAYDSDSLPKWDANQMFVEKDEAQTRGWAYDEDGTPEVDADEVVVSYKPWIKHEFNRPDARLPNDPIIGDINNYNQPPSYNPTPSYNPNPYNPPVEKKNPCKDFVNNKSNPLGKMKFAPPSSYNPKGATFGMTRTDDSGQPKMHSGIDLEGKVGDPIYAARGGTVGVVVSGQPNRIGKKYPAEYKGDKDGGGNRIYINNLDGTQDGYMHLQAGSPIAINPRTGQVFKSGDAVQMGDVIGYIGITGNASPDVPHLHFGVRKNGVWQDPFNTLNATFTQNGSIFTISTPCD